MRSKLTLLLLAVSISLSAQKKPTAPVRKKEELSSSRMLAKSLTAQGDAARAQKHLDDAELAYLQAIAAAAGDDPHPQGVAAAAALADLYILENRREEAVDANLTALQSARTCSAKFQECVKTGILLILKTARLLLEVRDFSNADPLVHQGMELGQSGSLPPEHHLVAMQVFAKYLEETSQPATAAVVRSQIEDLYAEGRFGPKPKAAGSAPAPLALLFSSDAPHPAAPLPSPKDKLAFFDSRVRFASIDSQYSLMARAEANLRAAIDVGEAENSIERLRVAGAMRGLTTFLWESRNRDEAIAAGRRMVEFVTKNLPPEGAEITQCYIDLGSLLINDRKREDALIQFGRAIESASRCTKRDTCDKLDAQARAMKGLILLGDGEFAAAEVLVKPLVDSEADKLPKDLYRRLVQDYADSLRSMDRAADAQAVESKLR